MQGMRLGAPGGLNPASYQSMPQQQQQAGGSMQQQGLPGRPGAPLSALGNLGGPGAGNLAGFQQQQQQQRVGGGLGGGMAGGGLAGLPRGGAGIGAGTYNNPPSGDLMSILNKAGGSMGRQEEGPPSFNAADFPSLSSAGQSGGRHSSQDGANETFAALLNSQKGIGGMMGTGVGVQGAPFGEEDFPALPGAGLGGSSGGGGRQEGAAGAAQLHQLQQQMGVVDQFENLRLQQHQQQQRLLQQQQQQGVGVGMKQTSAAGASPSKPGTAGPDRFGLLGLLSVIRMTDPDVTTLALGTDLTTLGLNLNSPEALWKTFASPWADGAGKPEPDFRTPSCYLAPPPRLTPAYFGRFQPDTLFYIFYGMPGDQAQVYAADELSNRGWYYHKELKTWLTRAPNTEPLQKTDRFERGTFFLFDPSTWNVVSKENFTVTFEGLERPSGLLKSDAGVITGVGVAGVAPLQGAMPVPAK
jgi:CCR4-NOT transcription complex subunit 2